MDITHIYLITNCFNDPNKVYIGKTINPKTRERVHKLRFGTNIVFSIIDNVNSHLRKDWEPLEAYWIGQFICWGFDVMNGNKKGGGGSDGGYKRPKEYGDKMSKILKGRKCEWGDKIRIGMMGKNTKGPVLQYNIQGEFIKEWNSQTDAESFYNSTKPKGDNIGACCRGKQKTAYGYIWKNK